MSKMTRARLARMSDNELLAYERERHGDPYMTLGMAKALRKTALKFWHLGAAREQAREDARRELRAKLWPNGS